MRGFPDTADARIILDAGRVPAYDSTMEFPDPQVFQEGSEHRSNKRPPKQGMVGHEYTDLSLEKGKE